MIQTDSTLKNSKRQLNSKIGDIMDLIIVLILFLIVYYEGYIILRLSDNKYEFKRNFIMDLIPFHRIYTKIKNEWRHLK